MQAAEKAIRIGALLPISGPGAYFGAQDKQGIELALEQSTGPATTKFEIKYEDSGCSPLPATQAAKRLSTNTSPTSSSARNARTPPLPSCR